jgi:hypothetical protein
MGTLFFLTIPGLVLLLISLAFAEVCFGRIGGERVLPWQRHRSGRPISAAGFEQITAFFQGSKHIEFEQRLTTLTHRDDAETGAPPRDEIDLLNGSARLVDRS